MAANYWPSCLVINVELWIASENCPLFRNFVYIHYEMFKPLYYESTHILPFPNNQFVDCWISFGTVQHSGW